DLPERFFELMTSGSQLAKQGVVAEALAKFAQARSEGSRILRRLLEIPKTSSEIQWQVITLLWAFKLVKSLFFWALASAETAESEELRRNFLLVAAGVQLVGKDISSSFVALDQHLEGQDRELLYLLGEAVSNFQERQQMLERMLKEQGINSTAIFGNSR
ncbi:MAG: hypothetical protein ACFFCO_08455, partial [Promethearchaeota archaeon]